MLRDLGGVGNGTEEAAHHVVDLLRCLKIPLKWPGKGIAVNVGEKVCGHVVWYALEQGMKIQLGDCLLVAQGLHHHESVTVEGFDFLINYYFLVHKLVHVGIYENKSFTYSIKKYFTSIQISCSG